MPISYPLDLPAFTPLSGRLTLVSGVVISESGTGEMVDAFELTEPQFRLDLSAGLVSNLERRAWQAWHAALNGAFGTFRAPDFSRLWPAAHPGGFAGWAGTATLSGWDGAGDAVFTGIPAGFVLTAGDLIQINSGGKQTIVAALAGSTSGTTRTLPVAGMIGPVDFPVGATALFHQPKGLFRLTDYNDGGSIRHDTVTVSGRQVLR